MTPISRGFGGRRRAAESLAASGLFIGQSQEFLAAVTALAPTADAARRES